jgi:hypothetical protein
VPSSTPAFPFGLRSRNDANRAPKTGLGHRGRTAASPSPRGHADAQRHARRRYRSEGKLEDRAKEGRATEAFQ